MIASGRSRLRLRRSINSGMLVLTAVCTLLVVAPLLWILGYVVREGLPALSPEFFTSLPTPVGEPGGGAAGAGSALAAGLVLSAVVAVLPGPGLLKVVTGLMLGGLAAVPLIWREIRLLFRKLLFLHLKKRSSVTSEDFRERRI